jgi:uncharacterized protein (DUF362 family)
MKKRDAHCCAEGRPTGGSITRRRFIGSLGAAAAGLALESCAGRKDPVAPVPVPQATVPHAGSVARVPFAPAVSSRVAKATIDTYDPAALRTQLESMFSALGGLSDVVRPGDTVGMKINQVGDYSDTTIYKENPCELYWTHPAVTRVVGELVKDAGAGRVILLEDIWDWRNFDEFGFRDVAQWLGADVVDLNVRDPYPDFVKRPVGEGWLIFETLTQNAVLNDIHCFVSLAKAKRHAQAGITGSMKNLVGTLPVAVPEYTGGATNRSAIHEYRIYDGNNNSNLCRVIIDLNKATPIHLAVVDAIKTTSGSEGPWNRNLKQIALNTLIASKDRVAADAISTQVMGFDPTAADRKAPFPSGINYLRLAQEKGLGTHDPGQIETVDATVTTGIRERRPLD